MYRHQSKLAKKVLVGIVVSMMFLSGCSTGPNRSTPTPKPSEANLSPTTVTSLDASLNQGQSLFNTTATCSACHTVNGMGGLVGPDLVGIANRIVKNHPDLSVEAALKLEIVDTNEHIAQTFPGGIMPPNYVDSLTPDQIQDIVAYLVSLD